MANPFTHGFVCGAALHYSCVRLRSCWWLPEPGLVRTPADRCLYRAIRCFCLGLAATTQRNGVEEEVPSGLSGGWPEVLASQQSPGYFLVEQSSWDSH